MADEQFQLMALPKGVQKMVFRRMDPQALLACSQCSHEFRALASDDTIWESKVARHSKDVMVCSAAALKKGWKAVFLETRGAQFDSLSEACDSCARDVRGRIADLEAFLEFRQNRENPEEIAVAVQRLQDTLTALKVERAEAEARGVPARGDNVVLLAPDVQLIVDSRIALADKGDLVIRGLGRARSSRVSIAQGSFIDLGENASLRVENVTLDRHAEAVDRAGTENRISVAVTGSASLTFSDVTMAMSEFSGAGVVVFRPALDITFERCSFKGGQHAIVAVAQCTTTVRDCMFESMETAIYCKANDMKLVVQRCQFTNCDSGGVSARKAADVSVTHSTFAGCVTQAVVLSRCDKAHVSNCVIERSHTATAVMARGCDECTITDNKISTVIVGISVDQCEEQLEDEKAIRLCDATIERCTISNASAVGVSVGSGGRITISDVSMQRSKAGVELHTERECKLERCRMEKMGGCAVALYEDARAIMDHCVAEECGEAALQVRQGAIIIGGSGCSFPTMQVHHVRGEAPPSWVDGFRATNAAAEMVLREEEAAVKKTDMTPEDRGRAIMAAATKARKCTRAMTGSDFVPQSGYECYECSITFAKGMALCCVCVRTCHRDKAHRVSSEPVTGNMFCDCDCDIAE